MLAHRFLVAALSAGALFTGCGGGALFADQSPSPIVGLTLGQWAWVEFPNSACEDGSPTGIAVSPGTGPDLLVFLNGGGACWDYLTCFVLDLASRGPFRKGEFERLRATALRGSILDRSLPGNPFREASLVFVPYCTGDVHAGDNVVTYTGAQGARAYHHRGRANLLAFLPHIAATFPSPRKLVVSGSSAGGFGAVLNYDTIRGHWPRSEAYLIDDAGPPLEAGAVSQTLLDAWFASWRLGDVVDPLCGAPCRTGLSPTLSALAKKYPDDRIALLSSLRDAVISNYLLLEGAQFESDLRKVAAEVIAPIPNARVFLVPGDGHTMLGDPAAHEQGIPLLTWLGQQVSRDPAWTSQGP